MVKSTANGKKPAKKTGKNGPPEIKVNPEQYDHPIGPEKAEV